MPFPKNNTFGPKKRLKRPLDRETIGFKGYEGQRERLKAVPDWLERIREFVDKLIWDQEV